MPRFSKNSFTSSSFFMSNAMVMREGFLPATYYDSSSSGVEHPTPTCSTRVAAAHQASLLAESFWRSLPLHKHTKAVFVSDLLNSFVVSVFVFLSLLFSDYPSSLYDTRSRAPRSSRARPLCRHEQLTADITRDLYVNLCNDMYFYL